MAGSVHFEKGAVWDKNKQGTEQNNQSGVHVVVTAHRKLAACRSEVDLSS